MKTRSLLIFLVSFPLVCLGDSYIFEGEPTWSREKNIRVGERYVVPECRRWLLLDIKKYNSNLWLEIDGVLEIGESLREEEPSHFLKGVFTYSNTNHPHELVAIIHPNTVVYLRGEPGFPVVVKEYKWFSQNETCK